MRAEARSEYSGKCVPFMVAVMCDCFLRDAEVAVAALLFMLAVVLRALSVLFRFVLSLSAVEYCMDRSLREVEIDRVGIILS